MKEIVILCPWNIETGGPEALHQLADTLLEIGSNVKMFYTIDSDFENLNTICLDDSLLSITIPERSNTIKAYEKYKIISATQLNLKKDTLIIIPETYLKWQRFFKKNSCMIWWLSVDNAFPHLDMMKMNLNLLKRNDLYHAHQSIYASQFLHAIGITESIPLSDYTPIGKFNSNNNKRYISMSALPHKVHIDVDYYKKEIEKHCGIEVVLIRGLSREAVYKTLEDSYVYIDFGNFPGKDRLPREAIIRDCCLITSNSGAAFYNEFHIPNQYIINTNSPELLKFAAKNITTNFEMSLKSYEKSKFHIHDEKFIFTKEAFKIHQLSNSL